MSKSLLLFRHNLRLKDNHTLLEAIRSSQVVWPLFIYDEQDPLFAGGALRWWLHHSLQSLVGQWQNDLGAALTIQQGDYLALVQQAIEDTRADRVLMPRSYSPYGRKLQKQLDTHCRSLGVDLVLLNDSLLFEPTEVMNQSAEPYKVFTPFYKACLTHEVAAAQQRPRRAVSVQWKQLKGIAIEDLGLRPFWDTSGFSSWLPGEAGAQKAWQHFSQQAVGEYSDRRDYPGVQGTSRLSPHLHFGEISPRWLWAQASAFQPWTRQLVWREFAHYVLYHFPKTLSDPFNSKFTAMPWREDAVFLKAWQKGLTGYPIVDAGMRELWQTGWMHNRVRMIVGSFLIKDGGLHWGHGRDWFADTLIDADEANNTLGWQWVAGCGTDAAPYFRIFNPTLQSKKFDSHGDYIRRWVPELASLPKEMIHEPSAHLELELRMHGVILGETYPYPIVDHHVARDRALKLYEEIKSN